MRRTVLRVSTSLVLLTLLASCSLAIPLDDYTSGSGADAGPNDEASVIDRPDAPTPTDDAPVNCSSDQKSCSGACVSLLDPDVGCSSTSCDPCAFAHAAVDGCEATGNCRLGACASGYANCNNNPQDGCESSLDSDPDHCGACATKCSAVLPNAAGLCTKGKCTIGFCSPGYTDCNKTNDDGCEVNTQSDPAHCGGCDSPCPTLPNSTFACTSGACTIASCTIGYIDCDKMDSTGCECGYPHAVAQCVGGGTTCGFVSCATGFANCNGNLAQDGCESDISSDPKNCGACGVSCGGGGCSGGKCQPVQLGANQGNPGQLAIDLDYVYWSNYGAGTAYGSIYRAHKDSQAPALVAGGSDTSQNGAWGIATDDVTSKVFWTTFTSTSHVGSALKVGSTALAVASVNGRLRGAVLDGSYLYWANYEQSAIMRVDITSPSAVAETVATGASVSRPNTIAFDASSLFWSNEGAAGPPTSTGAPTSLSNSGSVVALSKASIGGPLAVTTLVSSLDKPRGLAVDDTNVYFTIVGTAPNSGAVARVLKGIASQAPTLISSGLGMPRELALCTGAGCGSDPYLYISTFATGTVLRVAKTAPAGTLPATLATAQKGPLGIAADAKYVFWTAYGTNGQADGAIMKLVKQP
jgi:hypothetical protein